MTDIKAILARLKCSFSDRVAILAHIDALTAERDEARAVNRAFAGGLNDSPPRAKGLARSELEAENARLREVLTGARPIVAQVIVDYDDDEVVSHRQEALANIDAALAKPAAEPRGMSEEDRMDCYQYGTVDQWPAEMRKPDAGLEAPADALARSVWSKALHSPYREHEVIAAAIAAAVDATEKRLAAQLADALRRTEDDTQERIRTAAEAMRARCEKIAIAELSNFVTTGGLHRVAHAIAALKEKTP